jgi:ribonuclease HI
MALAYEPTRPDDIVARVYRKLWPTVEVWTDGSVYPNPGPGGYAAIVRTDGTEPVVQGSVRHTTNQRMELMGLIAALETLARPCKVTVYTNSLYVVRGCITWVYDWAGHDWKRWEVRCPDNPVLKLEPIPNADLWQRYWDASISHAVEPKWLPNGSGDAMSERADALAREARINGNERSIPCELPGSQTKTESKGRPRRRRRRGRR